MIGPQQRYSQQHIIKTITERAKRHPKRIAFPEAYDERVLRAANTLCKQRIVQVILIGNPSQIRKKMKALKLTCKGAEILDQKNGAQYIDKLVELRKEKGMRAQEASDLLKDPIYYATMLLHEGKIDGIVSGADHPTRHTFKPALQIIKTKPGIATASSYFMMVVENKVLFFADCALNIDPDAQQLADIAISTADTAKTFGFKPRVALLSFSTRGSGSHSMLDKIIKAKELITARRKDITVDGELQLDAALVPDVAARKAKGSPIKGNANVLIFPDLNAGNIGYKLTERLAHALAIGPISQGLRKPVNDLSRGCSAEDIVEVAAITALQAQHP